MSNSTPLLPANHALPYTTDKQSSTLTPDYWIGRTSAWEDLEHGWLQFGYEPFSKAIENWVWKILCTLFDHAEGFVATAQAQTTLALLFEELKTFDESYASKATKQRLESYLYERLEKLQHQLSKNTKIAAQWLNSVQKYAKAKTGKINANRIHCDHQTQLLRPLLQTGDEYWAMAASFVRTAKNKIVLHTQNYDRNSEGAKHLMHAFAHQLRARSALRDAKTPIEALEVIWFVDSMAHQMQETAQIREARAQAEPAFFHQVFPFPIDPSLLKFTLYQFPKTTQKKKRTSLRILSFDDQIALITSAHAHRFYHYQSNARIPWYDVGYILRGNAVTSGIIPCDKESIRTATHISNNHASPTQSPQALKSYIEAVEEFIQPLALPEDIASTFNQKRIAIEEQLCVDIDSNTATSSVVLYQSAKKSDRFQTQFSLYAKSILGAIDMAEKRIDINHCNISEPAVIRALKRAMYRGVDINLLATDAKSNLERQVNRSPEQQHIYDVLSTYQKQHRIPCRISLRWHTNDYFGRRYRKTHSKGIFIDNQIALTGSIELDSWSWRHCESLVVAFVDPTDVQLLQRALFLGFWDAAHRRVYSHIEADPIAQQQATEELSKKRTQISEKALSLVPLANIRASGRRLDVIFHQVLKSPSVTDKARYLNEFNQYFSPRIITEEAALERLAIKHIRLCLPETSTFHFSIRKNVEFQACQEYAPEYAIVDRVVDHTHGLRAYLLSPVSSSHRDMRRILVYEGTTLRKDAIRQTQQHPTGRRSATDPIGLGYTAFKNSRSQLLQWTEDAHRQGAPITLLGFSLGGVMASRHWHALDTEKRETTRLITFAMPGLDRKTAQEMIGTQADANIRHFRVSLDPFSRVGEARPPGKLYRYKGRRPYPGVANHTWAYLSESEIDGIPVELEGHLHDPDLLSDRLEKVRRIWRYLRPPL